MAECSQLGFELPGLKGKKIEGNFEGGNVTSDGGLVVLRQVDRWLGLTKSLAKRLPDQRDPDKIEHSLESMLRQRIYGLALGYQDLNDHDSLRKDLLWQTAAERSQELASCSTLCRLENRAGRKEAWLMHEVLFEQFLNSFESAPNELILDFDCTDDRVHGLQEGRHFHGYYYDFCFLPLYVFCGERLLVSYLRESNIDSAKHAWAILAILVKALRKRWPKVKIILRADSGFCRWRMLRWCERRKSTTWSGWPRTNGSMRSQPSCRNAPTVSIKRLVARCDFSLSFSTRLRLGTRSDESSPRPNNPNMGLIRVTL